MTAAKASFLRSSKLPLETCRSFQICGFTMPVPEYLLAMKCMAARIGGTGSEASDVADVILLAEVAAMVADGDSFDACLANFLDRFYARPGAEALVAEPRSLSTVPGLPGRALHRPWFASTLGALRAVSKVRRHLGRAICL